MRISSQIRITVLFMCVVLWITSSFIDYHLFGESNLFSPGPVELFTRAALMAALLATGEIIIGYEKKVAQQRRRANEAEKDRDLAFRRGLYSGNKEIRNNLIVAYQAVHLAEINEMGNEHAFRIVKENLESMDQVLDGMLPELENDIQTTLMAASD